MDIFEILQIYNVCDDLPIVLHLFTPTSTPEQHKFIVLLRNMTRRPHPPSTIWGEKDKSGPKSSSEGRSQRQKQRQKQRQRQRQRQKRRRRRRQRQRQRRRRRRRQRQRQRQLVSVNLRRCRWKDAFLWKTHCRYLLSQLHSYSLWTNYL